MRILVIEDELLLQQQLCQQLQQQGYTVEATATGEDGCYMGIEYAVDLAIIDLGLPDISGIEVIKKIRQQQQYPILILTARGRWQDKVEGLEAGADDYLVKPFQMEELLARINALLRRSAGWSQPVLHCEPIKLNTFSQEVFVHQNSINLTAYEYKTLEYLMLHQGKVISKTELSEHIYAEDDDRDSNVIEVFIGRLRRKLDPDNRYQPIETLRGRGYRFNLEKTA